MSLCQGVPCVSCLVFLRSFSALLHRYSWVDMTTYVCTFPSMFKTPFSRLAKLVCLPCCTVNVMPVWFENFFIHVSHLYSVNGIMNPVTYGSATPCPPLGSCTHWICRSHSSSQHCDRSLCDPRDTGYWAVASCIWPNPGTPNGTRSFTNFLQTGWDRAPSKRLH